MLLSTHGLLHTPEQLLKRLYSPIKTTCTYTASQPASILLVYMQLVVHVDAVCDQGVSGSSGVSAATCWHPQGVHAATTRLGWYVEVHACLECTRMKGVFRFVCCCNDMPHTMINACIALSWPVLRNESWTHMTLDVCTVVRACVDIVCCCCCCCSFLH